MSQKKFTKNFIVKKTIFYKEEVDKYKLDMLNAIAKQKEKKQINPESFIKSLCEAIVGRVVNNNNLQKIVKENNYNYIGHTKKYLTNINSENNETQPEEWLTIAEEVPINIDKINVNEVQFSQFFQVAWLTGLYDFGNNDNKKNELNRNITYNKESKQFFFIDTEQWAFTDEYGSGFNFQDTDEKKKNFSQDVKYFFDNFNFYYKKYFKEARVFIVENIDELLKSEENKAIFKKDNTSLSSKIMHSYYAKIFNQYYTSYFKQQLEKE